MTQTPREPQVGAAFVRLADTLRSDFDLVDLLRGLLVEASRIVGAAEGGVLLVDAAGDLRLAASIGERLGSMTPLELAAAEGSMHPWPLQLRGETLGAMCLMGADAERISAEDVALVQALVDVASIGILHHRAARAQADEIDQLRTALESRVVIEQAKGVLAGSTAVTMDDAFETLRARARNRNLTVRSVAEEVVAHTP